MTTRAARLLGAGEAFHGRGARARRSRPGRRGRAYRHRGDLRHGPAQRQGRVPAPDSWAASSVPSTPSTASARRSRRRSPARRAACSWRR